MQPVPKSNLCIALASAINIQLSKVEIGHKTCSYTAASLQQSCYHNTRVTSKRILANVCCIFRDIVLQTVCNTFNDFEDHARSMVNAVNNYVCMLLLRLC